MTTIEKDLLLKDLGARLPYGVKCELLHCSYKHAARILRFHNSEIVAIIPGTAIIKDIPITDVKLFLFPLSSMTEEQKEEFNSLTTSIEAYPFEIGSAIDYNMDRDINEYSYVFLEDMITCIDWLNVHHFDYRGLIGKQLAIDATDLNIY